MNIQDPKSMPLRDRRSSPHLTALVGFVAVAIATVAAADGISAGPASNSPASYQLRQRNSDEFRLAPTDTVRRASGSGRASTNQPLFGDQPFAAQIAEAARETALDPALVHALIYVESRYNPSARSPRGALGLMQVLPETASRYSVANAEKSIDANLKVGTRYLRDLMTLFDGRLDLVLAAYNAGEKAVQRHGQRIPPYRETQQYVPAVLKQYRALRNAPWSTDALVPQRIEYLPGTLLSSAVQPRSLP